MIGTNLQFGSTAPAASTQATRKSLILRDSLAFLVLAVVTFVLYGITSLLFHSFAERRLDVGRQYAHAGEAALAAGDAEAAINAFRTAATYAPAERSYQVYLAESLAQGHHTEEARNYFVNLLDGHPSDGCVNLELARLERQQGNVHPAVDYYRAATFGSWEGGAQNLRRQARAEFADYLIEAGDLPAAKGELLIMASNAPDTEPLDLMLGDSFLRAQDPPDASTYYKRAIALEPHDPIALFKAGSVAYSSGDYASAHHYLDLALRESPETSLKPQDAENLAVLASNVSRLMELTLSSELPADDRADHLANAATIARVRLTTCQAAWARRLSPPSALSDLTGRWVDAEAILHQPQALREAKNQNSLAHLIYETETQTAQICGAPSGDDALLLQLAKTASATEGQE